MKKFLAFLVALLVASTAYAAMDTRGVITETTLTDSSQSVSSGTINIADADKVSFFVSSSANTDSVTCEVTVEISYDGSNWQRAYFNDFAGGSTLQTSEKFYQDYYFWLDRDVVTAPYVRLNIHIGNTVGGDGADVTIGNGDYNTLSVDIVREK